MARPFTAHRLLLTLGVLLAAPAPAHAWGRQGHRLVGRLAEVRLSGDARRMVRRLLGGGTLGENAIWADTILSTRPASGPWHYIDVPLEKSLADWRQFCPADGCILEALARYLAVLSDPTRPDSDRAEALRFIVHFVGDLHMPLHVGENADRGGNDRSVTWNGRSTNLHSVWDTQLIASQGLNDDAWFGRLKARTKRLDRRQVEAGTAADWAVESHALSRDHVYALPIPPELAGSYAQENLPRAEDRIVRAGLRLAALLNRALGK
jgi:hypothetical protein